MTGEDRRRRYEICVLCGERWNVSIYHDNGPDGYICPRCFYNPRRETEHHVKKPRDHDHE